MAKSGTPPTDNKVGYIIYVTCFYMLYVVHQHTKPKPKRMCCEVICFGIDDQRTIILYTCVQYYGNTGS